MAVQKDFRRDHLKDCNLELQLVVAWAERTGLLTVRMKGGHLEHHWAHHLDMQWGHARAGLTAGCWDLSWGIHWAHCLAEKLDLNSDFSRDSWKDYNSGDVWGCQRDRKLVDKLVDMLEHLSAVQKVQKSEEKWETL
jgi:hypothetical protein